MFTLLIATGNPGKRIELQDLLQDLPVRLVLPAEIGLEDFDVIEDPDLRVRARMLSALISVNILENHERIRDIGDMINIMSETASHFINAIGIAKRG